jgi:putative flippase GtrA
MVFIRGYPPYVFIKMISQTTTYILNKNWEYLKRKKKIKKRMLKQLINMFKLEIKCIFLTGFTLKEIETNE